MPPESSNASRNPEKKALVDGIALVQENIKNCLGAALI
jgi:hypothetical protein